ncbi:uncharacterized protein LOC128499825 isoform X2 [Spea bombifrons]|uniref:uncharacterized protein LOC128499825 isoform X2 n=1 Tax=Spea bombifrons TaxID=233779 RepID=UPI0023494919|nr:uncharacterized protein LOC128499825 isoform X2 [Spea bombifrons]
MNTIRKCEEFIYSNFTIMQKLLLITLLFLLESFLDTIFDCPGNYDVGRVYSHVFIILPIVIFTLLSLTFRKRSISKRRLFFNHYMLATLECGEVILLWIFVLLIDGQYFDCYVRMTFSGPTLYYFRSYSQVAGLFGFTLYFLVIYFMTQHSCKSSFLSFWYRKRHEEHLLMDIEQILHNKLVEKRKNLVEELVSKDFDKVNPKEGGSLEKLAEMIRSYKDDVEKLLTEASDEKDIELVVQDS